MSDGRARSDSKRFSTTALAVVGTCGAAVALAVAFLIHYLISGHTGTYNSPVRVGGGAMTFRTRVPGGWKSFPASGKSGYCLNYSKLSDITFSPEITSKGSNAPGNPLTLSGEWSMLLYGRSSANANNPGNEWIELDMKNAGCDSGSTGPSLRILGSFYGKHDQPNDDGTHSERYFASDQACHVPGHPDPAQDGIDEDACERLSKITLTINSPDPNAGTYDYQCPNGECAIYIGSK